MGLSPELWAASFVSNTDPRFEDLIVRGGVGLATNKHVIARIETRIPDGVYQSGTLAPVALGGRSDAKKIFDTLYIRFEQYFEGSAKSVKTSDLQICFEGAGVHAEALRVKGRETLEFRKAYCDLAFNNSKHLTLEITEPPNSVLRGVHEFGSFVIAPRRVKPSDVPDVDGE